MHMNRMSIAVFNRFPGGIATPEDLETLQQGLTEEALFARAQRHSSLAAGCSPVSAARRPSSSLPDAGAAAFGLDASEPIEGFSPSPGLPALRGGGGWRPDDPDGLLCAEPAGQAHSPLSLLASSLGTTVAADSDNADAAAADDACFNGAALLPVSLRGVVGDDMSDRQQGGR